MEFFFQAHEVGGGNVGCGDRVGRSAAGRNLYYNIGCPSVH